MERKRVSLTLRRDLLKEVDRMVDGLHIRNRSHSVELLLSRSLVNQGIKQAYILAGGKGTRLRPITYELPKPLLPVKGKPILEHIIRHLKSYGVEEFFISVGHLKEKIIGHFKDGAELGVHIRYIEEDEPLGTAGALKGLKRYITGTFLMLNGDILSKVDIYDLVSLHRQNNASATIALLSVENPSVYGVARMKGSQIIEFIEKPKDPPSNLINAGLYLLEPEIIDLVPNGFSMIEKDVFPKLAKIGKLLGYNYSGPWYDIGTPEKLEKAIQEWE